MKILKKILLGIAAVVALLLIVALFVKKDYKVGREIIINKPKREVFNYVRYLRNQDNYSKWARVDPEMKKTYRGIDGTPGFVSGWESDNDEVGAGEQEIMKITEDERIDFELRFFQPFEATEPAFMAIQPISESQSKVIWGFSGHMNYPMNLMLLFIDFEEMIGSDLQIGLEKLKDILETQALED
ncbi:MAG TPA: SRPBCC family protein [Pseudosphingobacterium sp.]|nr:SRPBCC family protein [Pseudosphingobacterium sp.]